MHTINSTSFDRLASSVVDFSSVGKLAVKLFSVINIPVKKLNRGLTPAFVVYNTAHFHILLGLQQLIAYRTSSHSTWHHFLAAQYFAAHLKNSY